MGSSSHIPTLPGMSELELAASDVWATGISRTATRPSFCEQTWTPWGVGRSCAALGARRERVLIAGAVTHRQRPATAQG
ncbi:error-prone DNA polymerase domain protein [Mycobacterium ulcerans str. Harvey]|uniref:Error-prone DNA polymerase domain protein n=1 Tax=Mycobacterium ulcerans str. Harvey TaxID=1299332 RepID=A0ABN0R490_MYCUL|nr:error-prone DNA polymerase domain protein [Mycobacterium ulcerans str. Harvey]